LELGLSLFFFFFDIGCGNTADRAPGMFLWDDDKMVKEKKKKEKEKEKNREKAKEEADEVEHTAFNPLVFNRNLQEVYSQHHIILMPK